MPGSGPSRAARCSMRSDRGQSSVIGVVLILGLTMMGVTGIMFFGASALSDAHTQSSTDAAEHAMTQLDSKFSLVALGSSDRQETTVDLQNGATFRVDEDAGRMHMRVIDEDGGNYTILDTSLGAATYENDGTTIGYQGGGVWKRNDGGGSVMVSPPEFHYRTTDGKSPTLTVPLVVLRGEGTMGETIAVQKAGETVSEFPKADNATRSNPLNGSKVVTTVQSDYYQAWGTFFEERTSSNVEYDHSNETVTVELTVPFDEGFSHVLATTGPDAIDVSSKGGDLPSPTQTGIGFPSADSSIEERINECTTNSSACVDSDPNDLEGGTYFHDTGDTYYHDSDLSDDLHIDTADGNVSVVVNGTFSPETVDVSGDNSAKVYVRDDVDLGREINVGGDVDAFTIAVHSNGDVTSDGSLDFVGFLYAPESEVEFSGGGAKDFKGGIVGESIYIKGNPKGFEYDDSVSDVDLDLDGEVSRITYIHVSVNQVNVSSR